MKSIILIGFMGSGKSTVARALSELSGLSFADIDELIEERYKMTVSDFFEKFGEDEFRKVEGEVLSDLLESGEEMIIATGGGLPVFLKDKALLSKGLTVYLEVDPQTVLSRLDGDSTRPLLSGDDKAETITEMLRVRGPIYKSLARICVSASCDAKNIAKMIFSAYTNLEK